MFFLVVIKLLVVTALIKLLLETEKPLVCAGMYAVLAFGLNLLFGRHFAATLTLSAVSFGLAYVYFWLLARFQDSGVFWLIMVLGVFVVVCRGRFRRSELADSSRRRCFHEF